MSQPTTEVTKTTAPTEAIKEAEETTTAEGVLSSGENDNHLSNGQAVADVVETDELKINAVSGAEKILEDNPIHPTAEATPLEISPELEEARVTAHETVIESPYASGADVSTQNLGQTVGEFPQAKHDPSDTNVFPPVMKTGIYANSENNGAPLQKLWWRHLGELLHGIPPKILGGKIDRTPESQNILKPKTT